MFFLVFIVHVCFLLPSYNYNCLLVVFFATLVAELSIIE